VQHLIEQERFEIELLDLLNSKGFLRQLLFCGGTMLRLCHGLNRFSVDLDFWLAKNVHIDRLFLSLKKDLEQSYKVSDAQNKHHTLLYEIRSSARPRSLKIEIRKVQRRMAFDRTIAYSKHSTIQVLIKTVSLNEMMVAKIEAFLRRKEIRDAFDIEFLFKRGIELPSDTVILQGVSNAIDAFKKIDYTVKLGSLLEENQRRYYVSENFKILKAELNDRLGK